jgi:hypothetical protein
MKLTFNRLSFVPAFALTLGLCGLAMPASAQNQTPNPNQTQPRTQTQRSQSKHQTKSVTGCLEQGSNGNFMITAKDGTRYELQPMQGVKLASHVNHEVTVRGMVSPSKGMSGMTGSENAQRENQEGQRSPSAQSANQQTLQVRSVKTVSATCQQ